MGQMEVFDYLELNPSGWFSSSDLAEVLGISEASVCISCKRLRKAKLVSFKKELRVLSNRSNYHVMVHKHKRMVKK